MDQKVKAYLDKHPSPQKEICERLREIIFKTFPDLQESFKNGVPWYEDKYYIVALKDSVNIGFSIAGLTKKELDLFEGKGKYMRHIKIKSLADIDEQQIVMLLKLVKINQ